MQAQNQASTFDTSSHITPNVLTIAGSDSGGGAGIQADIKAMSATGSYAASVITALTAQNTQGVSGILSIEPEFVASQLDAVFTDLNIAAVKIGMLSDSKIIEVVAQKLKQYQPKFVVLDPVMVATSGDMLLEQNAVTSLIEHLLPLADLITPNLPEAAALTAPNQDIEIPSSKQAMRDLVAQLRQLPAKACLLKGGHLARDAQGTDLLITSNQVVELSTVRIETENTHGTGCSLSSAIASYLAQGLSLQDAIVAGKGFLTQALRYADELDVGKGHGPVHHFYAQKHHQESDPSALIDIQILDL